MEIFIRALSLFLAVTFIYNFLEILFTTRKSDEMLLIRSFLSGYIFFGDFADLQIKLILSILPILFSLGSLWGVYIGTGSPKEKRIKTIKNLLSIVVSVYILFI